MAVEDINDIIEGRVYTFSVVAALVDHYYPGEVNTLWKEGRKWTVRSRNLRASIHRCYPFIGARQKYTATRIHTSRAHTRNTPTVLAQVDRDRSHRRKQRRNRGPV